MPVGDRCWVEYAEKIRKRMFQERMFEITVPVDEIRIESRTTSPFAELRTPGYWNPCRDAKPDWNTFQRYGVELDFRVEADGYVHFVTFRLDKSRRATLERVLNEHSTSAARSDP